VKFVILRLCEYSILYVTLILKPRNNYTESVIPPAVCPSNQKRPAWLVVITLEHKIRVYYGPITQRFSRVSVHGTPLTSRSLFINGTRRYETGRRTRPILYTQRRRRLNLGLPTGRTVSILNANSGNTGSYAKALFLKLCSAPTLRFREENSITI
jgi:hypothetical protein